MSATTTAAPCVAATLGMFIIDQFSYQDSNNASEQRVLPPPEAPGGAGLFFSLGARLSGLQDGQVLFVIDRGSDWPQDMQSLLDLYNNKRTFCFRDDSSRLTTRSLNTYSSNHGQVRGFEYLTPRKRLGAKDLMDAQGVQLPPKWIHLICAAGRASDAVEEIKSLGWSQHVRTCFEPVPNLCRADEMPALEHVLPHCDIFSPNHTEAQAFFGGSELVHPEKQAVEKLCAAFFTRGAKDMIVIRCGSMGACGVRRSAPTDFLWVPAYHHDQAKVVDPTGGGNSFLGGLATGMHESDDDLLEAMIYASVSASYFIEQFGLPRYAVRDGRELWNEPGEQPPERRQRLRERITATRRS